MGRQRLSPYSCGLIFMANMAMALYSHGLSSYGPNRWAGNGSAFIGCFASCYARMAFNLMVRGRSTMPARDGCCAYVAITNMLP